jgi:hypothetical protein
VKLQFFQSDFFDEVFRIVVGRVGKVLKFCFVLPVLLAQTLVFGVCLDYYVPRVTLQFGHAVLLINEL